MIERDAIDRIVQLATDAKPIVQAPDHGVTGRFYVRQEDGRLEQTFARRRPTEVRFRSTESLAGIINDELDALGTDHAVVYYSSDGIQAELTDTSDPIVSWRHELPLPRHPVFQRLEEHARTRVYSQRDLIRFLRAELNGHVDETVIEQFRALKVTIDGENNSVIAKGREAVDRRIQQRITEAAGNAIPDAITVSTPVYDLDELREATYQVQLLVDVTPGESNQPVFELTSVHNTLRVAEDAALGHVIANLQEHLANDDVGLYHGRIA